MPRNSNTPLEQRRRLLAEIQRLADVAIFGTISETYRTCGNTGCRCRSTGPKHGPHLYVSYRGDHGKTTGYYVPKAAHDAVRRGVAAWQTLQDHLRELGQLNKEHVLASAKEEP
jgi:hypothetical protein